MGDRPDQPIPHVLASAGYTTEMGPDICWTHYRWPTHQCNNREDIRCPLGSTTIDTPCLIAPIWKITAKGPHKP
jgi:hypothetical protein